MSALVSSTRRRRRGRKRPRAGARIGQGALALALASALSVAPCRAMTSATIAPSLSPDRLGARGALTVAIHYRGEAGEFGVPAPVRGVILHFPSGLALHVPELRSCSAAQLRARGVRGCPAQSRVGGGYALLEARPASAPIRENVSLAAFLGPPRHLQPTVELFGQGRTPIDKRMVLTGALSLDHPPYGEQLTMHIPAIPTQPLEPDASIVTFSLTVGTAARAASPHANAIVIPRRCPAGGFPFAAEFSYADGSQSSADATAPCPR